MSRVCAAFLALALGLGAEACDPCAGTLGCSGEPRLSIGGQLIVHETGVAVEGAVLDFVRTGGVGLARDSVRTTTDGEGRFQLAVEASDVGEVIGDLAVRSPAPWLPYRVRGLTFRTSEVRGEGQILGRLVVDPYFAFVGVLNSRRDGRPLAGAQVRLYRTGGVYVPPECCTMISNSFGYVHFEWPAAEPGEMIADVDIVVGSASGPRHYRRSGVRFAATYLDRVPEVAAVWTIGAWLPYVGALFHRGSQSRSAGIEVEFQRTGGILADPDTFVVRTNAAGLFPLVTTPLEEGELIGNLIVRPPAPTVAETISAVRMATVDTDQLVLLGVWGYGYGILYGGALFLRGTGEPAPAGLAVEFRRTGGIAIMPESFVVQTDDAGRFPLAASATGAGQVVGDLTSRLPAPLPPTIISGVRLATFASDEMRFLGSWWVGPSLRYVGEILSADTDAPIVDAEVGFQRTGGIAVAPTVLVTRTIASGLFSLGLNPLDTGEVVGSLTIRPPSPFRDTTITGIRLHTFDNDSVRLAGTWRIAPPP